jgi:hypothetical protein
MPRAGLVLLVLGVAGAGLALLVPLLDGPDPGPETVSAPPGLSVPRLQERAPETEPPSPGASSRRAPTPSGAASPRPSRSATASGTPAPQPSASTLRTLRMGDSGAEVRALQERLRGQGFTYVSTTGVYDSQTKRGVAQLQRDRDIKGDQPGVYGPATQRAFAPGG